MKKYTVLIILATLLCISCKKDEPIPTPNSGKVWSSIPGYNYGTLQTFITQVYFADSLGSVTSTADADFCPGEGGGATQNMPVYAGNVTLNNIPLGKFGGYGYPEYQDTSHILNLYNSIVWDVSGSNEEPAFTYSCSVLHPLFTNAQLPDSVSRANGFTVNVGSAAVVALYAGSYGVSKSVTTNNTSCTFSPGDLAALPNDTNAELVIVLSNQTVQYFQTRQFTFNNTLKHIKYRVKVQP